MITRWVDPRLGRFRGAATATLEQLLELAGWTSEPAANREEADITYGVEASLDRSSSAFPSAGEEAWKSLDLRDRDARLPVTHSDLKVPAASLITTPSGVSRLDVVLAAHFFLSGTLEAQPTDPCADRIPTAQTVAPWNLESVPVVQRLVNELLKGMGERSLPAPRPRWPMGKRWAMCISHDCDRPVRYRTRSFARDVFRTKTRASDRARFAAKLLVSAVRSRPRGEDPYEQSTMAWLKFQQDHAIRGTYYIGTWGRYDTPSDARDLVYSRHDPEVQWLAKTCEQFGAEVGLHSSIHAWTTPERFSTEVERVRESYGAEAHGFRGHYWSLDATNPEASLRIAAASGLKHSSALGMNTVGGFRRGSCYPYRPFDRSSGDYVGLCEVPPTLMDEALFQSGPDNSVRIQYFKTLAETVRKNEGVLVLDWHSDSLWPGYMDGVTDALLPELAQISNDSDCWLASAQQISDWCTTARWQ